MSRDSAWYHCTLSTLWQFYRKEGEKRTRERENKRKEGQWEKTENTKHIRVQADICCQCVLAVLLCLEMMCRLSHLSRDLEVTVDMLCCFCPSPPDLGSLLSPSLSLFCHLGFCRSSLARSLFSKKWLTPPLDHSKIVVGDFRNRDIFTSSQQLLQTIPRLLLLLKQRFVFSGL